MPDDNEVDEVSDVGSENEYEDAENSRDEHDDDIMTEQTYTKGGEHEEGDGANQIKKPKLNPKDPLRPRRKKARRACFACQRAHLTCGDERPCQRCIKRGLGNACQDGVRKKAKYLHDAPPEALRPVLGSTYNPNKNGGSGGPPAGSPTTSNESSAFDGLYSQVNTSPTYSMHFQTLRHTQTPSQMPPPLTEQLSFTTQQSPISPIFQTPNTQRPVSMQSLSGSLSTNELSNQNAFGGPLFDPSNPALFNFDLEGLNFGNHYGALEFGMLNHMSAGAAETPPQDSSSMSQQGGDAAYNNGNVFPNNMGQFGQIYPQQDAMLADYVGMESNPGNVFDVKRNHVLPRAYAIEMSSPSFASPATDSQASPQPSLDFGNSPPNTAFNATASASGSTHTQHGHPPPVHHRHTKHPESKAGTQFAKRLLLSTPKRSRDPSSIYKTVVEPYPYTTGFHSLTAFIQRRFSPAMTLKIAKSLASIRPSFISCTKTLNKQDLIFMEKCFQRTLFEYEEFMRDWGTPTLVCRRTGEIAAANKEFTLLTGWTNEVLLGKETNLNINTGKSSTQSSENPSQGNTGRAGLTTPRMVLTEVPKGQEGRPQPVFVAELLDDDTVIDFYEDFARLAFGDARGSVNKRCRLLKYQTKEGLEKESKNADDEGQAPRKEAGTNMSGTLLGGRVSRIDGENGIGRLQKDGKLDCSYCWMVKRDVFDIPMLIVMNGRAPKTWYKYGLFIGLGLGCMVHLIGLA